MKKTVLKFGTYGAITICALFLISWFVLDGLSFSVQEVLGYVSIILSLSFVYFGIKHYRDRENSGKVRFKDALAIGVLISLITALVFGLLDVFYTEVLNPDFMSEYYENAAENLKATLPADQLDEQLAQLEAQHEEFSNPLMSFTLMALTVFMVGFIISLLTSLILQRK